ncbi:MAG: hypothetical protein IJ027_07950 [Oscillospiraceae bacterium]|nr:hypothetical protein [Oscillospiraceae bacterium]
MPKNRGNKDISRDENKLKDSSQFEPLLEIAAESPASTPETPQQMINSYGTYEIQPTANTPNDFPAIAQGTPKYMKERPLEFFRDGDDPNPAADMSDRKPL